MWGRIPLVVTVAALLVLLGLAGRPEPHRGQERQPSRQERLQALATARCFDQVVSCILELCVMIHCLLLRGAWP